MSDNKMHLGLSPITKKVYLGRQKNGAWQGQRRDVTNEFLQVMEQKFPVNTAQNISIDGKNEYRVIVVGMDKDVIVNGKAL